MAPYTQASTVGANSANNLTYALMAHVEAALSALADGEPELVLSGGLIAAAGPLAERLRAALKEVGATVAEREIDAPLGAAHLALGLV